MINVYLNVFMHSHLLFGTLIGQCLFENQVNLLVLSARWPLNKVKENGKTLIGTTIRWLRQLIKVVGWLIGVLFTIFYSQKLWDFND